MLLCLLSCGFVGNYLQFLTLYSCLLLMHSVLLNFKLHSNAGENVPLMITKPFSYYTTASVLWQSWYFFIRNSFAKLFTFALGFFFFFLLPCNVSLSSRKSCVQPQLRCVSGCEPDWGLMSSFSTAAEVSVRTGTRVEKEKRGRAVRGSHWSSTSKKKKKFKYIMLVGDLVLLRSSISNEGWLKTCPSLQCWCRRCIMATICSTLFICGMSSLVVHTHAETKSRTEIKKENSCCAAKCWNFVRNSGWE